MIRPVYTLLVYKVINGNRREPTNPSTVYTFGRVHRYIADNLENSDTTKVNSELKIHKMVSVSLLSFASATTIVLGLVQIIHCLLPCSV
jgi:hypothetical protein